MLTTIDRFFNDPFFDFDRRFFAPAKATPSSFKTDIKDNGDSFLLEAELPGFKKEDISLDIDGDILTLTAKRTESKEEKDGKYLRRERSYGEYSRSFDISEINVEKADATYENGILTLTLPKKVIEQKKNLKLEIR